MLLMTMVPYIYIVEWVVIAGVIRRGKGVVVLWHVAHPADSLGTRIFFVS